LLLQTIKKKQQEKVCCCNFVPFLVQDQDRDVGSENSSQKNLIKERKLDSFVAPNNQEKTTGKSALL
jgi:hypothetical protein